MCFITLVFFNVFFNCVFSKLPSNIVFQIMSGGMRLSAGRKQDPIWCRYDELLNKKVKCKECNKSFSSNADRMRAHSTFHDQQANVDEEQPVDSTPVQATQSKMEPFVIKTTQEKADQLDILVGKSFYANNIPFSAAESNTYKEMMANLRPGYRARNSKSIGNPILEKIFCETTEAASKTLAGERVTLCMDGWSNINNDPIVAASIQYGDKVYVVDSVDTSGLAHTGENLANLCDQLIEKAQEMYRVVITAVVTDNAANMIRMRKLVSAGRDIVQYGCSAHQLNLLAKDLGLTRVTNSIVEIAKFFRNTHLPNNSIQVAQAVEAWKDLLEKFRENTEFREWLEKCEARYNVSVPDVWFVANLLHPKLIGNRLTQFELKESCFLDKGKQTWRFDRVYELHWRQEGTGEGSVHRSHWSESGEFSESAESYGELR